MDIGLVLESEDVRGVLRDYAAMYKPGLTSEEFLEYFRHVRLGASLGRSLGEKLGLRSATKETFALPHAPIKACVALLCGLVAHGVKVELIEQSAAG